MGNVDPVARTGDQPDNQAVAVPRIAGNRYRPVRTRRLSDQILVAFHAACDINDYEVARQLLELSERVLQRATPPDGEERRHEFVGLAAAHFRLWGLLHANEQ